MEEPAGCAAGVGGSRLGQAIAAGLPPQASVIVAGRRIEPLEATASLPPARDKSCPSLPISPRGTIEPGWSKRLRPPLGAARHPCDTAGILEGGSIDTTTIEDWDRTMDVNVRSLFELTRLSIPTWCARDPEPVERGRAAHPACWRTA